MVEVTGVSYTGNNGFLLDYDVALVLSGARNLGLQILHDNDPHGPEVMHVGNIYEIQGRFRHLGAVVPFIDYPDISTYGRKISRRPWKEVRSLDHDIWIKSTTPKGQVPPMILKGPWEKTYTPECMALCYYEDDEELWSSDIIEGILSEWRAFIINGEIIDCRMYRGDWRAVPDREIMQRSVDEWPDSPLAYVMDFIVVQGQKTLALEVNDGWGVGAYGLRPDIYCTFLKTRWEEIMNTCRSV